MNKNYQVCQRCVMDTSAEEISFDKEGICNFCTGALAQIDKVLLKGDKGAEALKNAVAEMKNYGRGKKYDCIIGLSGGVDSSYLAWLVKEQGLRPLAVHVDGGWNSELATKNIENIVKKLNIDLITHVVDWSEMKDLQVAYLKAAVANQDTPQDHAIFALLYNFANKNNIKYVISGYNFSTESILPFSWGYRALDLVQLRDIHRRFGSKKLKSFPQLGYWKLNLYYRRIKAMKIVAPLNYIDFNKSEAMAFLEKELGWRYYGGKHHESRFTKFFQAYYLPQKFGYDKRKAHLSSLIVSGQMTREDAIEELSKPLYEEKDLDYEIKFIKKKLGLSDEDFTEIMNCPIRHFSDYKSNHEVQKFVSNKILPFFRK